MITTQTSVLPRILERAERKLTFKVLNVGLKLAFPGPVLT